MPYYVLNFAHDFSKGVIRQFIDEYMRGRTPNPCIVCNELVKFGILLEKARELDAQYVATGHYAQVGFDPAFDRYVVRRGVDPGKDQSYTMQGLFQEQLKHMLTPLGAHTKDEIREIARELGLVTANKPDSQEICFVPDGDYREFMRQMAPESQNPGPIVNSQGEVLGTHEGIAYYTIGQRRGLGIAAGSPLYVIALDPENNTVVVGGADEVRGGGLVAYNVNWVALPELTSPRRVLAQIRYNAPAVPAVIYPEKDGSVTTRFLSPQRAITPGQRVVWFEDDILLGGGIIDQPLDGLAPEAEAETLAVPR